MWSVVVIFVTMFCMTFLSFSSLRWKLLNIFALYVTHCSVRIVCWRLKCTKAYNKIALCPLLEQEGIIEMLMGKFISLLKSNGRMYIERPTASDMSVVNRYADSSSSKRVLSCSVFYFLLLRQLPAGIACIIFNYLNYIQLHSELNEWRTAFIESTKRALCLLVVDIGGWGTSLDVCKHQIRQVLSFLLFW